MEGGLGVQDIARATKIVFFSILFCVLSASGQEVKVVESCHGNILSLSCSTGHAIAITSVELGETQCYNWRCCPRPSDCTRPPSDRHRNHVLNECNGRQSCQITAVREYIDCNGNSEFERIRYQCVDINECASSSTHTCSQQHASCVNTPGGYRCQCAAGFTGDGLTCIDVNECSTLDNGRGCGPHASCINKPGNFTCQCNGGFTGDGFSCEDVNECEIWRNDLNCSSNADCINTPGSFTCQCHSGFTGDGFTCDAIDTSKQPIETSKSPTKDTKSISETATAKYTSKETIQKATVSDADMGTTVNPEIDLHDVDSHEHDNSPAVAESVADDGEATQPLSMTHYALIGSGLAVLCLVVIVASVVAYHRIKKRRRSEDILTQSTCDSSCQNSSNAQPPAVNQYSLLNFGSA